MEKTHLARTRQPRPSLRLSPRPSPPARWPLLDLLSRRSRLVASLRPPAPSVPPHLEAPTASHSSGQPSGLTRLPCGSNALVAQLHLWQVLRAGAHACVCSLLFFFFNPFNHGKCSAGLSELTGVVGVGVRVTVQLNAVQVTHYPKHCR